MRSELKPYVRVRYVIKHNKSATSEKTMKQASQQSLLGFFLKTEKPKPHENEIEDNCMSPCVTESHHEIRFIRVKNNQR